MSHSQLVLSDRPLGYWESPSFGVDNLLTQNQYSIETSTSGWSAVDSNTSISRVTSDAYVGSACLKAVANSATEAISTRISSGSRIQVYPGRRYTMIARVKRVQGSRNARIRIEYFTTQSGSTLSEPVRFSKEFEISSSEWTTIYHTDLISTPNDNDYFISWGVSSTDSGSVGDELLIDGIQFYEGSAYQLKDYVSNNNINIFEYDHKNIKPIVFGTDSCVKLLGQVSPSLENIYKLFISGTENKQSTIEFWFAVERPPSYRHDLLKIGTFLNCYVERDRIFIESSGKRESIQVVDWELQHYVAISYMNRKIDLYFDDRDPVSVTLDEDFRFNDLITTSLLPSIVFGPCSTPRNLLPNPSFEEGTDFWESYGNGTSISINSSDSYSGNNSVSISKSDLANSGIILSNRQNVQKYQTYQLSAQIKVPSGQETSSIKLICKTYDGIFSTSVINTYEDSLTISDSDGWQETALEFTPGYDENYIEIIIVDSTAGATGQTFLIDALLLEKSKYAVQWDELSDSSDPLFISSIALYPFAVSRSHIQKRLDYARNDISESLAIRYSGDRINTDYNSTYSTKELDITELAKTDQIISQNLIYTNNGFYMPIVKPASVSYGLYGGSYDLDSTGISFSGDCYIDIENVDKYFNTYSSTIRMQIGLDETTGDGVLLSITPIVNSYALIIKKESNKIVGKILNDPEDATPHPLFESNTLTTGEYNLAFNFTELALSAKVGAQEFNDIEIPNVQTYTDIFLGNLPSSENAFPDRIRNFAIDPLTEFEDIEWYTPELYMLRFNGDLNVSQTARLQYTVTSLDQSNNSIITFNDASKPYLFVNDEIITEPSNIPAINYSDPEPITINVELFTENAYGDNPKINNLFASSFNSNGIVSSLSNFILTPNTDINSNFLNNSYAIKSRDINILAHDSNIGIKFNRGTSTGCKIVKNSSDYESIELVFKITKYPNSSETYNIFDLSGETSTGLSYSDAGLNKYGTYDLYIDGQLISSPSDYEISVGEIYHMVVVLPAQTDSSIHLGNNKSSQNMINGSIGKICIYENTPTDIASYVSDKYQDLIGRISRSISGGSISATDESITPQTYYRNSEYFEMIELPKVKFVSSSWEEIDLVN
jgi:hypothetical protein